MGSERTAPESGAVPAQRIHAGPLEGAVAARLRSWRAQGVPGRLWRRDHRLWSRHPEPELVDRLGWLDLPASMAERLGELGSLADEVAERGIDEVVLIGMGGSSLAAAMFQQTLGRARSLRLADSTHPDRVRALCEGLDPASTLFVVASKSGTTVETDALMRFFWAWAERRSERPGSCFVAITDRGTRLAQQAREQDYLRLVEAPADVGGRYSALGPFGLVPAALTGVEVGRLLESGAAMAARCGPEVSADENPALELAALLGESARAGRSLLRLGIGAPVEALAAWLEQLVAESTGKGGLGILPVLARPPEAAGAVDLGVNVEVGMDPEDLLGGSVPAARIRLQEPYDLGAEVFRWQVAIAMASSVLGVQPFNQPDVQLAKELAARAVREGTGAEAPGSADAAALAEWLSSAPARGYLSIQAFLAPSAATDQALERLRRALGRRSGWAVTSGYGPQFLHSTGQLHKGGPDGGRFLQLVDRPREDLRIPDSELSFGRLLRAQADGDAAALASRGRSLLRIDLAGDAVEGLDGLAAALDRR